MSYFMQLSSKLLSWAQARIRLSLAMLMTNLQPAEIMQDQYSGSEVK